MIIAKKNTNIVIFIHGTTLATTTLRMLKYLNFLKKKNNDPLNKNYKRYFNLARKNGLLKYQIIDKIGLYKADDDQYDTQTPTTKIIKSFKYYWQQFNSSPTVYYTFGWSGCLSDEARMQAAKELLDEIKKLQLKYKNSNLNVNIFAHSHGGNVALNLARIKTKDKITISNLYLLGTPIQVNNSRCILSNIFTNIYNIYSNSDIVQIMDIISSKNYISKRIFDEKHFKIPNKLIQLNITCDNLRPIHHELWFINDKINFLYRNKLILNPYPLLTYVPAIKTFLDQYLKINKLDETNNTDLKDSLNVIRLNISKYDTKLRFHFSNNNRLKDGLYFIDFPNTKHL